MTYTSLVDASSIGTVPVSSIVMYSGVLSNLPTTWKFCDGTNGTVDLRNKFIMSINVEGDIGSTGGSGTTSANGAHTHTWSDTSTTNGSHNHTWSDTSTSNGAHTHSVTTASHYHKTASGSDGTTFYGDQGLYGNSVEDGSLRQYIETGNTAAEGQGKYSYTKFSGGQTVASGSAGSHTHDVSGTTSSHGGHTHNVSGTTASNGSHTHTITPPYFKLAYIQRIA